MNQPTVDLAVGDRVRIRHGVNRDKLGNVVEVKARGQAIEVQIDGDRGSSLPYFVTELEVVPARAAVDGRAMCCSGHAQTCEQLEQASAEHYAASHARLVDIIDEQFGLQPVMTPDALLSFLEEKLGDARGERAKLNAPGSVALSVYSRAELAAALEGNRVNVTDSVTHDVVAKIGAWLRDLERRSTGDRAETLDEVAGDLFDGEWRRPLGKPDNRLRAYNLKDTVAWLTEVAESEDFPATPEQREAARTILGIMPTDDTKETP